MNEAILAFVSRAHEPSDSVIHGDSSVVLDLVVR